MINIDASVCKACGICGNVCPRHIPYTVKEGDKKTTFISQERINLCMECGHCEAICPNNAITLEAFRNEQFSTVEPLGIDETQFLELVKQRRSIRRYKDKPVPRESINRIVQAARYSPTGTGRRTTGVIILDDPKKLKALSKIVYSDYETWLCCKKLENRKMILKYL